MTAACAAPAREPLVALKGPLRALIDSVPRSLAVCTLSNRTYVRPFWRPPVLACALLGVWRFGGGWPRRFELDADSVVVSTARSWTVPPFAQRAWWRREADRLTQAFGTPVRSVNQPPEASSLASSTLLRTYCAAWRGPDSVEVTLYLDPATDVGGQGEDQPWQLRRYARYGPLLGAVSRDALVVR